MATIAARITDLIGEDYTSIATSSSGDLIDSAINEVADMLPPQLLLKYAVNPRDFNSSNTYWNAVEGKKVLLVTRKDGASGYSRECTPTSIEDFAKAQDVNSIYLATKYSPVYSYETDGGTTNLNIFPTPTDQETAKAYYFEYASGFDTSGSTIDGLPKEILQSVVLKACINILQAYISDFVQDEEDVEMQGMLMNQIQSLNAQFQLEMQRYSEADFQARGE
tara:strand:+ start:9508 stop:10173 length:666 start_codon:yes stop_codon:yes gene_type:complete